MGRPRVAAGEDISRYPGYLSNMLNIQSWAVLKIEFGRGPTTLHTQNTYNTNFTKELSYEKFFGRMYNGGKKKDLEL
jgi:hypothetical protein